MLLNDLKMKTISLLQESNISIEGVYYVVKDILEEIERTYNQALENERQKRLKEISEIDNKQGSPDAEVDKETLDETKEA